MNVTRKNVIVGTLLVLTLGLVGCGNNKSGSEAETSAPAPAAKAEGKTTLKIAVIPKGTSHEFWKSIHAGAIKAGQELQSAGTPTEILWKGSEREDDRNGQINVVETFVSQQVSGIVLAPLDSQALTRPVHDAVGQKIPVVIMDSALGSTDYISFVATDNQKGGGLGGQQLAKLLGGKGRVLLMRYQQGSASTEQREAGFLAAIKKTPGITLVSGDQFGGATTETAYKTAQNLLNRYGAQIDGVFTPNETTTRGMRLALKDAGLLGKVKFVGFDASPDLIQALQAKEVQALVVQNPFKMGYLSVKTLAQSLKGEKVEKRIDTGVALVTPDNMNAPAMKDLLHPPLDQYLK